MLIDFIKAIHYNVCAESLLRNRDLQFTSIYNHSTSELYNTCTATIDNLTLTLKGKYLTIEGSLHKYSNFGKHNFNDFTYSELVESIDKVCCLLQLDAQDFIIQKMEFGVNLQLPFKTSDVLNNLLIYQNKPICKAPIDKSNLRVLILNEYRLKIYDKALQYGLTRQLMRFEVHIRKMRQLDTTGIETLLDLMNRSKLKLLSEILINRWQNVLLFDWTINKNDALKSDTTFYYQVQNQNYWLNLNKNQRNKMKEKYRKMVLNHSSNIQQQISSIMLSKFAELGLN